MEYEGGAENSWLRGQVCWVISLWISLSVKRSFITLSGARYGWLCNGGRWFCTRFDRSITL